MEIEYERYETKIHTGEIVLGKLTDYGITPKYYSNRTQAEKSAKKENGEVIRRGRPFYVLLTTVK